MKSIRRLSRKEARRRATEIAIKFLEQNNNNGWEADLYEAAPDSIKSESVGKTPRYWNCIVLYRKDGHIFDGVDTQIVIDLVTESAKWGIESL